MIEMMPSQPNPNTPFARFAVGAGGFVAGIGAQILLQAIVNKFVGPIPALWSPKMWLLVAILLIPPFLTYKFWVIDEGSLEESFARGVQAGAIFGFIVALLRAYPM